jgi:hypothetical protein
MDLVTGVVGMVVLAGIYVALGLADRGRDGCEGCLLRGDTEGGCLGCPELREPGITRRSRYGTTSPATGARSRDAGTPVTDGNERTRRDGGRRREG